MNVKKENVNQLSRHLHTKVMKELKIRNYQQSKLQVTTPHLFPY